MSTRESASLQIDILQGERFYSSLSTRTLPIIFPCRRGCYQAKDLLTAPLSKSVEPTPSTLDSSRRRATAIITSGGTESLASRTGHQSSRRTMRKSSTLSALEANLTPLMASTLASKRQAAQVSLASRFPWRQLDQLDCDEKEWEASTGIDIC